MKDESYFSKMPNCPCMQMVKPVCVSVFEEHPLWNIHRAVGLHETNGLFFKCFYDWSGNKPWRKASFVLGCPCDFGEVGGRRTLAELASKSTSWTLSVPFESMFYLSSWRRSVSCIILLPLYRFDSIFKWSHDDVIPKWPLQGLDWILHPSIYF